MARALVLLAEGFEEIEAVTIADVLRRAGVQVTLCALRDVTVTGSHQIALRADATLDDVDPSSYDALVLPGGLPGATTLRDDVRVRALLVDFDSQRKLVGAVCAAPIALEAAGILRGRRATSYPGHVLPSSHYEEAPVVRDGNIITSRGPGTSLAFALELVSHLVSATMSAQLATKMLVS